MLPFHFPSNQVSSSWELLCNNVAEKLFQTIVSIVLFHLFIMYLSTNSLIPMSSNYHITGTLLGAGYREMTVRSGGGNNTQNTIRVQMRTNI